MQTYNLQKLNALLKDFYNLSGIKICVYDYNGTELCYYPERLSAFCKLLRADEKMDARCKECDKKAFAECKKTQRQYVYTCHAGLTECVSPILYGGSIIGYVAMGQIKENSHSALPRDVIPKDEQTCADLSHAYATLPSFDRDRINSAIHIMDACTGYEYLKNLMSSIEGDIETRISAYISDNLSADLSVLALCSAFHLSHSEIYSIFKRCFSATPAEHVKKCRLTEACHLLESTKMPVNKIAAAVGIPDYNYFSKIFKKEFLLSPRDFRRQQNSIT